MLIASTIEQVRDFVVAGRRSGKRIGLVPTMGALHSGHLSLVEALRIDCDLLAVSIFVNPTQFGPHEDLAAYPRTLENDCAELRAAGVDLAFVPSVDVMYPAEASTRIVPPAVSRLWEGEFRPTHFAGVATVVLKLFQIVQPDVACFGQKDYQQSLVVRHLVRDLNVPVEIRVAPTMRDADGLAMSSRNRYLSADQRQIGLSLWRTLRWVASEIERGAEDGVELRNGMQQMLIDGGVDRIDYAVVCDPQTLALMDRVRRPAVALIAARVGATRLIDNWIVR